MRGIDHTTRRQWLKATGVAAGAALLAGCPDDEENDVEDDEDAVDEDDAENGEPIDPDQEIMLDGLTENWVGMEPEEIADEENPTLTLLAGEAYEITWVNGDGAQHNIEIRDEDDEVVDDYETELMDEEGETQTLEVDEVTDDMVTYICEPHEATMVGDIEVVEENDDAADDEENGDGEENDDAADDEPGDDEENDDAADDENGDE